jgi:hypothetical protein
MRWVLLTARGWEGTFASGQLSGPVRGEERGMNEHEELLARALACLTEASKIEDPVVRAKVLELAYHSQRIAQASLLRGLGDIRPAPELSDVGASFRPSYAADQSKDA